jgi:putative DNA primase/helicase
MSLRELARALGGEVSGAEVVCPGPGHGPKDRSLAVRPKGDDFLVHSFARDDARACLAYVRQRLGVTRPERRRERPTKPPERRSAFVASLITEIVHGLVPVRGTPGEQYLRDTRKIDTDAVVDVLERVDAIGWHPAVYFHQPDPSEPHHELHGRQLGAIIGMMTDPVTAKPTGAISRTYLGLDGAKIGKAKTFGAPTGIVRLSRDEDVEGGPHLCEGLETGLCSMALGFRPLWATGSTSLMRVFPLLGNVECLTILADRDGNQAGEQAAIEAASRWREAGREARIKRLNGGLGDINDAVRREPNRDETFP